MSDLEKLNFAPEVSLPLSASPSRSLSRFPQRLDDFLLSSLSSLSLSVAQSYRKTLCLNSCDNTTTHANNTVLREQLRVQNERTRDRNASTLCSSRSRLAARARLLNGKGSVTLWGTEHPTASEEDLFRLTHVHHILIASLYKMTSR